MKFCSTCGAEINEGAAICVKCGCAVQGSTAPVGQLKTNKGLCKFIFLSIITLGIYGLVVMSSISNDTNIVASRYDGKKTMHYCLLFFLIGPITLGIAYIVWLHKISNRIGNELRRRNINYSFSCADYWLWNVLGSLIVVGPFIYYHKLFKATNLMCADYNAKGWSVICFDVGKYDIKRKRIWLLLLFVVYFSVAYAVMKYYNISCVFMEIFKIPCPGCGMTRAFLSLIKMDFYQAAKHNLVIFFMPYVFLYIFFDFKHKAHNIIIMGIAIVAVINWANKLVEFF